MDELVKGGWKTIKNIRNLDRQPYKADLKALCVCTTKVLSALFFCDSMLSRYRFRRQECQRGDNTLDYYTETEVPNGVKLAT